MTRSRPRRAEVSRRTPPLVWAVLAAELLTVLALVVTCSLGGTA